MTGSAVRKSLAKIAVFDSGVGGLSIYQEMQRLLPPAHGIYCSDNAFFPYGTKADDVVTQRVVAVAKAMVAKYQPDIYVVACNTASTVALEALRRAIAIPVVGVVPAIKPAASSSKSKIIGLLATPATVRRPYTDQLIKQFASGVRVERVGSARLVAIAEESLRGALIDEREILREIKPLFVRDGDLQTDTIVLGCTHFPLLAKSFAKVAPWPVCWLDSGAAVAAHIKSLLPDYDPSGEAPDGAAVFTQADAAHAMLAEVLRSMHLARIEIMSVG